MIPFPTFLASQGSRVPRVVYAGTASGGLAMSSTNAVAGDLMVYSPNGADAPGFTSGSTFNRLGSGSNAYWWQLSAADASSSFTSSRSGAAVIYRGISSLGLAMDNTAGPYNKPGITKASGHAGLILFTQRQNGNEPFNTSPGSFTQRAFYNASPLFIFVEDRFDPTLKPYQNGQAFIGTAGMSPGGDTIAEMIL